MSEEVKGIEAFAETKCLIVAAALETGPELVEKW